MKSAGTISSKQFTYHKESGSFISEMAEVAPFMGQVLNDSCDEGFFMVSSKTGIVATFVLAKTNHDKEGEIWSWDFKGNVSGKTLKARIFND